MSSEGVRPAAALSPMADNGAFKFVGGFVLGFVLRSIGKYLLEPQVGGWLVLR